MMFSLVDIQNLIVVPVLAIILAYLRAGMKLKLEMIARNQ